MKLKTVNTDNVVVEIQFLLVSILVFTKTRHRLHLLLGCESFFKLSLLFICARRLDYDEKQLFVSRETTCNFLKLIDTIAIMAEIIVQHIHVKIIQMISFASIILFVPFFSGIMKEFFLFFMFLCVFDSLLDVTKREKIKQHCSVDIFIVFGHFVFFLFCLWCFDVMSVVLLYFVDVIFRLWSVIFVLNFSIVFFCCVWVLIAM